MTDSLNPLNAGSKNNLMTIWSNWTTLLQLYAVDLPSGSDLS